MYEQPETVPDATLRSTARPVTKRILAGVLVLYVVLVMAQLGVRFVSPSLFPWGSGFLPMGHGIAITLALLLSCVPVLVARRMAPQANRWVMIGMLSITFLCGVVFLAVQSVEYENSLRQGLGWGTPVGSLHTTAGVAGETGELGAGDVTSGRGLWQATCLACHGAGGEGVEGQGKDLRQSAFVLGLDDAALLAFIKNGRPVADPLNTTGKPMPPKGGNPLLKDPQVMDLVAFIRSIQVSNADPSAEKSPGEEADAVVLPGETNEAEPAPTAQAEPAEGFWIPSSSVPLAALGPQGLSPQAFEPPDRPARAIVFFGFFFLTTGVHIVQVVIGLVILAWLIFGVVQAPYRPSRDLPVGLAGGYWCFTVAVWIVLFPMFYFT